MNILLNIARNALAANRASLAVDSQNTTNAATPGYTKESVNVTSLAYDGVPGGAIAQQVTTTHDTLALSSFYRETSTNGFWSAQQPIAQQLGSLFNEPQSGGIQETLQGFSKAWNSLSNNPTSQAAAQDVLSQAQNTAQVVNSLTQHLNTIQTGLNRSLSQTLAGLPNILAQIATLNQALTQAQPGTTTTANIVDQINHQVKTLSALVPITVLHESNGTVIINSQNIPLVSGKTIPLAPSWTPNTPPPALGSVSGHPAQIRFGGMLWPIASGTLGGELAASQTVATWQTQLAHIVSTLATIPANSTQSMFSNNHGVLKVTATSASPAAASTALSILSTNQNQWATLVGQVGASGQMIDSQATASQSHLTSLSQSIQSQVGVNLNQTAASMISDQQAFVAAAKIMSVAQQVVQSLLQAVN